MSLGVARALSPDLYTVCLLQADILARLPVWSRICLLGAASWGSIPAFQMQQEDPVTHLAANDTSAKFPVWCPECKAWPSHREALPSAGTCLQPPLHISSCMQAALPCPGQPQSGWSTKSGLDVLHLDRRRLNMSALTLHAVWLRTCWQV